MGIVSFETIAQLLEVSAEVVRQEFVEATLQNRAARRKALESDKDAYDDMVLEYNDNLERLLDKVTEDMLAELNLTKEIFENSLMVLM